MVRLRIALGVASSFVAVAALTIVFAGTGEAQGNGNGLPTGPNVVVTNTPLPVTGNVTATMSGNVSATIINPSNGPVFIRDVDRQSAKEPWQTTETIFVTQGGVHPIIEFDPVPAGKLLVIEHVSSVYRNFDNASGPKVFLLYTLNPFNPLSSLTADLQYFVPQQTGVGFIADAETKFYVAPGTILHFGAERTELTGSVQATVTATGYLVNYP
jgi:hypothetical protein